MVIAIVLIAIVTVLAVGLSNDGRDLNFGARDVHHAALARSTRR